MYNVNDKVVYKGNVCVIKEIKKKYINNKDYYVMVPINDNTLKIEVPVENKLKVVRSIITKEEAIELIDRIPSIDILNIHEKVLDSEYKILLNSDSLENLVKIIKTTYLRNHERQLSKRRISEKDDTYFKMAEKRLYTELSISLDMSYDKVKEYIIESASK